MLALWSFLCQARGISVSAVTTPESPESVSTGGSACCSTFGFRKRAVRGLHVFLGGKSVVGPAIVAAVNSTADRGRFKIRVKSSHKLPWSNVSWQLPGDSASDRHSRFLSSFPLERVEAWMDSLQPRSDVRKPCRLLADHVTGRGAIPPVRPSNRRAVLYGLPREMAGPGGTLDDASVDHEQRLQVAIESARCGHQGGMADGGPG